MRMYGRCDAQTNGYCMDRYTWSIVNLTWNSAVRPMVRPWSIGRLIWGSTANAYTQGNRAHERHTQRSPVQGSPNHSRQAATVHSNLPRCKLSTQYCILYHTTATTPASRLAAPTKAAHTAARSLYLQPCATHYGNLHQAAATARKRIAAMANTAVSTTLHLACKAAATLAPAAISAALAQLLQVPPAIRLAHSTHPAPPSAAQPAAGTQPKLNSTLAPPAVHGNRIPAARLPASHLSHISTVAVALPTDPVARAKAYPSLAQPRNIARPRNKVCSEASRASKCARRRCGCKRLWWQRWRQTTSP